MRKHIWIALLCAMTWTGLYAQSPQAVNYQAVVRDASGSPVTNQNVGLRLSILDGSPTGTAVYVETHSVTSNDFGLVNLQMGAGSAQTGTFSGIDWSSGAKYVKVEMDPTGGTSYVVMGTQQLISVPYALYAETAGNSSSLPSGTSGQTMRHDGIDWIANSNLYNDGTNVGVGNSSPTQKLDVSGTTRTTGFEMPTGASNGYVLTSDGAGVGTWQAAPGSLPSATTGQTMRYDGSQWTANSVIYNNGTNVGIGTSSPTQKLDVSGTARMTGFEMPTGAINGYVLTSNGSGVGTWQALPASGGNTLDQAYDEGGAGAGRVITVDAGAVELNMATASGTGMDINVTGSNGIGARADVSSAGVGFLANSTNSGNGYSAIQASTNANNNAASAVVGNTTGLAYGVSGQVDAAATAEAAIYGSNLRTSGGHGVRGVGFNGVVGETNYQNGYAVYGENYDGVPSGNGIGVAGRGYYGVFGEDRYLGGIAGAYGVYSNGNFGASGTKTFRIDHPLDPYNKFLVHSTVESNEVLNMYRGTVTLDGNGEAVVELPDYFDTVNINETYHLTPIGGFAQLYVKSKVQGNTFEIAGGTPGLEVNWIVYAERNDPYMQNRPHLRDDEPLKSAREQGKLQIPSDYGRPESEGLFYKEGRGTEAAQPVIKIEE